MEYVTVPGSPTKESTLVPDVRTRVTPRRWAILGVFLLFCMSTNFQWVQYTIVGDLVARYYQIPTSQLDWTSLIFMVTLTTLMLPVSFLLDKKGVSWSMKVGALLVVLGSWIKVLAVAPGCFPLALLGQGLVAASQVFEIGAPARVAAVWFGPKELSTACAIGILGNELGSALGFLLSPLVVRPHEDPSDIGEDLKTLLLTTAAFSTLIFLLVVLVFKDRPDLPPSPAQALERCSTKPVSLKEFLRSVGVLLTNGNYLLLLASSGISGGALNVVGTVLNPLILPHFPNGQEFAGRVGLVMTISGILGELLLGILLDKTHKFKEVIIGVFVLQALSNSVFHLVLQAENAVLVYITMAFLGLSVYGYAAVLFESAMEVTYPVSESTVAGLLLIPANILGFAMTVGFTWTLEQWGDSTANGLLTACLVLGAVITTFVRKDYRRLAANSKSFEDHGGEDGP